MSAVRGQIQYGVPLVDTSGLDYPTGLPGFSAFELLEVQPGTGTTPHQPNTANLKGYVTRLRYTGAPNCAALLPRGSPGVMVYVLVDADAPAFATAQPFIIWCQDSDQIFVTVTAGQNIGRKSVLIPNGSIAMFICFGPNQQHVGQKLITVGAHWRVISFAAPGIATPGALMDIIPQNHY